MEKKLEEKDLEAYVSFGFVLNGQIGDFFKLRHFVQDQLQKSRLVYHTFSRNPLFLVNWNDLSQEKQDKIKEGEKDEQKEGREAKPKR